MNKLRKKIIKFARFIIKDKSGQSILEQRVLNPFFRHYTKMLHGLQL